MEENHFNRHRPELAFEWLQKHEDEKVREAGVVLFWNIQLKTDQLDRYEKAIQQS